MLTRGGILIRNPRLKFIVDPEDQGGGEPQEPSFPKDTPVKEMSAEQQAAYYKHQARKHEDRVKAYGDFTPEKLTQLQQEAETLRQTSLSAADKAIEEAREEGRSEIRAVLGTERFKSALASALAGRNTDPLALVELASNQRQFIKGDMPDKEALSKWVEENSTPSEEPKKKVVDLGQGRNRGSGAPAKGVSSGAELFADRRKPKSSS